MPTAVCHTTNQVVISSMHVEHEPHFSGMPCEKPAAHPLQDVTYRPTFIPHQLQSKHLLKQFLLLALSIIQLLIYTKIPNVMELEETLRETYSDPARSTLPAPAGFS